MTAGFCYCSSRHKIFLFWRFLLPVDSKMKIQMTLANLQFLLMSPHKVEFKTGEHILSLIIQRYPCQTYSCHSLSLCNCSYSLHSIWIASCSIQTWKTLWIIFSLSNHRDRETDLCVEEISFKVITMVYTAYYWYRFVILWKPSIRLNWFNPKTGNMKFLGSVTERVLFLNNECYISHTISQSVFHQ